MDIDKIILKLKTKELGYLKQFWKNRLGEISQLNFKTYYIATLIKNTEER